MITKESLKMLGEAAQKYGLRTFQSGDMKLTFSPPPAPVLLSSMSQNSVPIGEAHGMPTDEQMLFASSIPMTDEEIMARPPHA